MVEEGRGWEGGREGRGGDGREGGSEGRGGEGMGGREGVRVVGGKSASTCKYVTLMDENKLKSEASC